MAPAYGTNSPADDAGVEASWEQAWIDLGGEG